jgi:hypothetical protein
MPATRSRHAILAPWSLNFLSVIAGKLTMKSKIKLIALACLLTWGAMAGAEINAMDDCVKKATIEGSFMSARIFRVSTFIPRSTQRDVMKRVAKTVLKEGLTISNIDRELGILSASFSKRAVGTNL